MDSSQPASHSLGCTRVEHILCEFRLERRRGEEQSIPLATRRRASEPLSLPADQPILLSQLPLFWDRVFIQNSCELQCLSDIVTTSGHSQKIVTGRLLSQGDNSWVLKGHLGIVTTPYFGRFCHRVIVIISDKHCIVIFTIRKVNFSSVCFNCISWCSTSFHTYRNHFLHCIFTQFLRTMHATH